MKGEVRGCLCRWLWAGELDVVDRIGCFVNSPVIARMRCTMNSPSGWG